MIWHACVAVVQIAVVSEDAWALRMRAYEMMGMPLRTCPGRTTLLVVRGEDAGYRRYGRIGSMGLCRPPAWPRTHGRSRLAPLLVCPRHAAAAC